MADYDKEKWAKEQEQLRKDLSKQVDGIIAGYEESPEKIAELMAFKARFYSYSIGNTILIQEQNSHAVFVGSFQKFKEMGYSVKKGEKGMKIFVPVTVTLLQDEDGSWTPLSEASDELKKLAKQGLIEKKTVTRFKLGTVFDLSQTSCPAKDYPRYYSMGYPSERHGALAKALAAFCQEQLRCPVSREDLKSISLRGEYLPHENRILLSDKLEDTQRLCTLTHEMGHAVLHQRKDGKAPVCQIELEADAFSILLESYLGIPLTDARKRHLSDHYHALQKQRDQHPEIPALSEILKHASDAFGKLLPQMWEYLPKEAPSLEAAEAAIEDDENSIQLELTHKKRAR